MKIHKFLFAVAIMMMVCVGTFAQGMPELTQSEVAPMINLFNDSPPIIKNVTIYPEKPYNDESVTISARVFQNMDESSLPVEKVEINYRFDGAAEWQNFEMLRDVAGKDGYFAVVTPPAGAKRLEYSIVATDLGGNTAMIVPAAQTVDINNDKGYLWVADANEEENLVPKDLDFLNLGLTRDANNLYIVIKTEGTPSAGNLSTTGANFYFVPFFPPGEGISAFLGGSGLVLGYTPMAASLLGIPKYGLFNIKDIIGSKKNQTKSNVKMVKGKDSLTFTVPFSDLGKGDEWVIAEASGRISTKGGMQVAPIDSSPFARIIFRGGDVALRPAEDRKPAPVRAGAATYDISSPVGAPLAGYGDRVGVPTKGIHDSLMGSTLIIESEGRYYCMTGLDFFYMRLDVYKDIAKRVNAATGLPESCIFMGASHSHTTSGALIPSLAILGGKFDRKVYDKVTKAIVDGYVKAYKSMKPAKIGVGYITEEEGKYTNGNRRSDKNLEDHVVGVIRVDGMDGKPIATLFNHSGHPTGIDSKKMYQSSDFVGPARNAVAKQVGGVAVFFNGSLGDHSARCYGDCPADDYAKVKKTGEQIAEYVVKERKAIKTSDKAEIREVSRWLILNKSRQLYTVQKALVFDNKDVFLTMPGEAFFDPIGNKLREQAKSQGFDQLFILGLTNDGLGYIYPEELYYTHAYESTYTAFGPKMSPFIVDNASDLLKSLGSGSGK
jgi:neutral ceramidase